MFRLSETIVLWENDKKTMSLILQKSIIPANKWYTFGNKYQYKVVRQTSTTDKRINKWWIMVESLLTVDHWKRMSRDPDFFKTWSWKRRFASYSSQFISSLSRTIRAIYKRIHICRLPEQAFKFSIWHISILDTAMHSRRMYV